MTAKPRAKPRAKPKPKKPKALLEVERQIRAVRQALLADPGSMQLAMELSGLNAMKWSVLGEDATRRGEIAEAAKCAVQEGRWAEQKSRDAKQLKTDLLRELKERVEKRDSVRRRFSEELKSRSANGKVH